ncbi:hypothetical protein PoB_003227800 [Plakobranchus ocellatus]|uniref:SMB domain-containing protein n=1 Tax=Plakobranchus ocellatus TaxID=259542 RepID=A0AAV4AGV5_9GAST|nr:hypothetical protein PoB_003227800 [Plakobranchus ocellatus]
MALRTLLGTVFYGYHHLAVAGVMMLLTRPVLLCSTPVSSLNSMDGASTTFVTSSTLPLETGSENHTTARRSTVLHKGQILSNCQENLETFNPNLNNSYPDQLLGKVAISPCANQGSIDNLTHSARIKMSKKTFGEIEKQPKEARAIEFSPKPDNRFAKHRPPGIFSKQKAPLTLEESTDNIAIGNLENYTVMIASKEKDSFGESTLGLGQVTLPTIVDDEQGLDLFLTFTCQGRCGKKISFPCSCSATCVIYDTCCANMAQDCPHVWEKGLTRFDLIRTADYICDQNSIYIIISCPDTDKESFEQNEMELKTSNKQMLRGETEIQNQSLSNTDPREQRKQVRGDNFTVAIGFENTREDSIPGRLLAALSAGPVTDSDSGLTFINKTVYNCNKMPESNILQWAVLLDYIHVSPTRLEDFVKYQMLNNYQPGFNKKILTDHICMRNIKQTCNETRDSEEPSGIYFKKCLESNNAVVVSNNPPFHFYRNRFCAYCNEGRYNEYRLHLFNNLPLRSSLFQVLMTLTEDTISLRKLTGGFATLRVPWLHAKCPIQAQRSAEQVLSAGKSEQDSQTHCSVTCGDPNFTLRSDGICKAPHQALLAIADDGLAPLCPEAMAGLARFLVCGLKQEIENLRDADFSAPSVSVVFDSSLNRSLYVVRLHLALPQSAHMIFSYQADGISQNIYSVALLAKSFHHYRKSRKICQFTEEDKNTELKVFASSSLIKFGLRRYVNLTQDMEELRGPTVDDHNKTTVCLTKTAYCHNECSNILNPNHLLCMDDPEHKRDSAWISRFHTSSCSYYFNQLMTKAKNRAATLSQGYESLLHFVLLLNFLAVTILVDLTVSS